MDTRLWLFGETGMLLSATEMKRVSVEKKNYKGQMHWMLTETILFSGFKGVEPMVLSSSGAPKLESIEDIHPLGWRSLQSIGLAKNTGQVHDILCCCGWAAE